jgi:hypothetical protein
MERRDTQHELWLEMQTAYNKYRHASDVLKAAASRVPISISPADETPGMPLLVLEQRAAFESYIEARLQYSEFERDPDIVTTIGSTIAQCDHQPKAEQQIGIRSRRWLVVLRGFALVGIFSLSFAIIIRESRAGRDPKPAPLSQSRVDLQAIAGKLDGLDAAPTARPHIVNPKYRQATGKIAKKEQPSQLPAHKRYEFTLTVARKFKQIGPISISLRDVDSRRLILDLLIVQKGSKPAKVRVNLNKPTWVKANDGSGPIELVATQIRRNYVRGFLSQSKTTPPRSAPIGGQVTKTTEPADILGVQGDRVLDDIKGTWGFNNLKQTRRGFTPAVLRIQTYLMRTSAKSYRALVKR